MKNLDWGEKFISFLNVANLSTEEFANELSLLPSIKKIIGTDIIFQYRAGRPPIKRKRHLQLIEVLVKHQGITSSAEADEWLEMGEQGPLGNADRKNFFPNENIAFGSATTMYKTTEATIAKNRSAHSLFDSLYKARENALFLFSPPLVYFLIIIFVIIVLLVFQPFDDTGTPTIDNGSGEQDVGITSNTPENDSEVPPLLSIDVTQHPVPTGTSIPPTAAPTSTATETPTPTSTGTSIPPTATATSTATETPTPTSTGTSIPPTATATSTITESPIPTSTSLPTETPLPPPTNTPPPTITPTPTPTATVTLTATPPPTICELNTRGRKSIEGNIQNGIQGEILLPIDCAEISSSFYNNNIRGSYTPVLNGYELWPLVYALDNKYHLQAVMDHCPYENFLPAKSENNEWFSNAAFGGEESGVFTIVLVIVEEDGAASKDFKNRVKEFCENGGDLKGYHDDELPPGIQELDFVDVYVWKNTN